MIAAIPLPELSTKVVAVLLPYLPKLLTTMKTMGGKMIEKAGEKFAEGAGGDAWRSAKAIWEKLHGRLEQDAALAQATSDVADAPNDARAISSLELNLERILRRDPELAQALRDIVHTSGATAIAKGPGAQALNRTTNSMVISAVNKSKVSVGNREKSATNGEE